MQQHTEEAGKPLSIVEVTIIKEIQPLWSYYNIYSFNAYILGISILPSHLNILASLLRPVWLSTASFLAQQQFAHCSVLRNSQSSLRRSDLRGN